MKDYKFSMDFWNDCHYKNFEKIAGHCRREQKPVEILEIGTFEGRTTTWILENIENSNVVCIEPEPFVNFHNNLDPWLESGRLRWIKEYSFKALIQEYLVGNKYDLVYVDGDHFAPSVLQDAILSWKILKKDGILLFDDFGMIISDNYFYISHKEFENYKNDGCMWIHPREGIQAFLNLYKGQYKFFIDNYQVGVQKICEVDNININHGHKDVGLFK